MKPTVPALIADCATGDIVRTHSGVVRVCSMTASGERWCRLVDEDLRETNEIIWLSERLPVLETLRAQRQAVAESVEVDPLMRRLR